MDKETIDSITNIVIGLLTSSTTVEVIYGFTMQKFSGEMYEGEDTFLTRFAYKFFVKDKLRTTYQDYLELNKGNRQLLESRIG